MNTRQAFEYWFSDGGESPQAVERRGDGYKLMQAQQAWNAWQAATAAERKACAMRCEEQATRWPGQLEKNYAAHECAAAIRARSKPDA